MARKPHNHMTPSGFLCVDCGRHIKANVVARKVARPELCFRCYQAKANLSENMIRTARDIRVHPENRSKRRELKGVPLGRYGGLK